MDESMRLRVVFFKSEADTEPVRDWLKELQRADRKVIGEDIKTVQFGWPLGLPLVGVVPCEKYADDFDATSKERLETLLGLCERVERMPFRDCGPDAYLAAGLWMVERCDFLIAVWDKQSARGIGGTTQIVEHAITLNKTVLHIPVVR